MERGALGPNNSVHQRKNMKAGDPAKSERREMLICLADLRKETECPICLGIIRKTRTVMECLHRFCRECIDKAMRIGNNECPACRVHCASRRSLRADPNFDSLIAALYPDIDKYEEEELAFRDEDTERNRRVCIQERIAETQRRQTEALVKRRSTIPATGGSFPGVRGGDGTFKSLRSRGRTRSKTLGVKRRSEAIADGEREGQLREIGRRTIRRPRIYEEAYLSDSLGVSGGFSEEEEEGDASFGEGGADEADPDFENNIGKRRGASATAAAASASAGQAAAPAAMSGEGMGTGAVGAGGGNAIVLRPPNTDVGPMLGNSTNSGGGGASPGGTTPQPTTSGGNGHNGGLVTWARNGVRSHNRYGGNGNGGGNKLVKSLRAAGLLDALSARREEEKAYEIHFCMCPLPSFVDTKEEPLAPLERMYLCCAPEIAVFHLRKFLKSRLVPTPQGELELVVQRLRQPFLDIGHGTPPAAYMRAIAGGPKGGGSLLLGRGFQRPMELEVLSDSRTLQTILSDSWDFRGTLVLFYRLKK